MEIPVTERERQRTHRVGVEAQRLCAMQNGKTQRRRRLRRQSSRVERQRLVGIGEFAAGSIADGDDEIVHRQQLGNGLMNLLIQRGQIFRAMRRFGNGIERRLHRFGLLALGDVARHADAQFVIGRPAGRPHDVHYATVLAHVTVLEVQQRLIGHDRAGRGHGPFTVFGIDHLDHPLAEHLLRRIAEDAFTRGAGVNEVALRIDDADRVQQQIDDTCQGRAAICLHGGEPTRPLGTGRAIDTSRIE